MNPALDLTHAQRDKALSGRVLEIAGKAKLGKGEVDIRAAERNKASKRVREGLLRKKDEREKQQLEEVRFSTSCHPIICRQWFALRPKIWEITTPLLKNCLIHHLGPQAVKDELGASEWEWASLVGGR